MSATEWNYPSSSKPNLETPIKPSWMGVIDNTARRMLDIVLSVIGILLLFPLFVWIAVRIKHDSPGPIFYRGLRAGKDGRTFYILKFRTMFERSESYQGPRVTARDDTRITPFGHWLRDTKLNEFPQLWNVLLGEMSLVGPRPEDVQIAAQWPAELAREVLSVRPGVTSPASVLYRDEEKLLKTNHVMDSYLKDIMPSKLRLDQLYVRYRTVLADLDVIFWTMVVLLPTLKGYTVPEHLLYRGPLSLFIGRYLGWFLIDMLVSFAAIGTAGVIWRMNAVLDLGITLALGVAFVFAVLFSLLNSLLGINRVNWRRARAGEVMELAVSSGVVSILVFIFNLFWMSGPLLPPAMLLIASMFSFMGSVAVRYRLRLVTGLATRWIQLRGNTTMRSFGERVLIIGAGELGQFAASMLRTRSQAQAFSIVGMLDDDPQKIGSRIESCEVVGRIKDIPGLVRKHDVGVILYAISNIEPHEQSYILSLCKATPARTIIIPDILMAFRAHLPQDEVERDVLFNQVLENTTIDRETGANNRFHFIRLAEGELPRSRRYGRPLSVIMFSVDCDAGLDTEIDRSTQDPRVLQWVVDKAHKVIRSVDILGRYNTNHFAILLPETGLPDAEHVADRLRQAITSEPVNMGYTALRLSMKAGVVMAGENIPDATTLLETAEKVMEADLHQA